MRTACPDIPEFVLSDILSTAKEIAAHPNACQELMSRTQENQVIMAHAPGMEMIYKTGL